MEIELVREEIQFDTVHVTFNLRFDNRAFTQACMSMIREEKHLPINANVFFEIFPFCIVFRFVNEKRPRRLRRPAPRIIALICLRLIIFSSDMVIRSIGNSLMVILSDLVGRKINNWFDLVRPLISFKFQNVSHSREPFKKANYLIDRTHTRCFSEHSQILNRVNNIFELVTVEPVLNKRTSDRSHDMMIMSDEIDSEDNRKLKLRGKTVTRIANKT